MLRFALYPSNHGYGHAARVSALAEEFNRFGIFCIIRSQKPDFLFGNLHSGLYEKSDCGLDFGVKHGLNLVPNLEQTRQTLLSLLSKRQSLVESEIEFLRREQIDLIISDVPFLIFEAAKYAQIPVVAVSNFDWSFIYGELFALEKDISPIVNMIYGLYSLCDLALRLPFGSKQSMSSFPKAQQVGLLARKKAHYQDVRTPFGIERDTKLLLSMFGGEGSPEFDLSQLCKGFEGVVISTNPCDEANHIKVKPDDDFLDLIHAADLILTKPGYSSFAEAVQFGKPLLYYPRNNYPEEKVLIAGLQAYGMGIEVKQINQNPREWKTLCNHALCGKKPKHISNHNVKIASMIIGWYFKQRKYKNLHSTFDIGSNNCNYLLHDGGKVLHQVSVETSLGRGLIKGMLRAKNIRMAKKSITSLADIDKAIASKKNSIATQVSREASNISEIKHWFEKKYHIPYQVISERDEYKYNYWSALKSLSLPSAFLAFDIGGGSTEFVNDRQIGFSIPLGIVKLMQMYDSHNSRSEVFARALEPYQFEAIPVIGCGLTMRYIAEFIYQTRDQRISYHGKKICRTEIEQMLKHLTENGEEGVSESRFAVYKPEIAKLVLGMLMVILDKNRASELVVCEYGISLGYYYAKKYDTDKRTKLRRR